MPEIFMQTINFHGLKCCKKCQVYKPLTEFHINSKKRGAKPRSVCKDCRKQERRDNADKFREKDRKYYRDNLDRIKAANRKYYQENRDRKKAASKLYVQNNKEKVQEYQRKWREANSEHLREWNRNYKENNVDKYKRYYREYRIKNPEKEAVKINNRRARKKYAEGNFSHDEWKKLCEKYQNSCLCCGANDQKLTPDHIVPLSRGGSNKIENIQPLCMKCNLKKSTKTIDYRI